MMDDDCDIEKLAKLHDVDLSHINKEGENCLHIVMHAFGSNEDTSVILARKKILTMLLGHFSMTKEILNAPVEGMDYTPAHYAANANSIDLFEVMAILLSFCFRSSSYSSLPTDHIQHQEPSSSGLGPHGKVWQNRQPQLHHQHYPVSTRRLRQ